MGNQKLSQASLGCFVMLPAQEIGDEGSANSGRQARHVGGGQIQSGKDVIGHLCLQSSYIVGGFVVAVAQNCAGLFPELPGQD